MQPSSRKRKGMCQTSFWPKPCPLDKFYLRFLLFFLALTIALNVLAWPAWALEAFSNFLATFISFLSTVFSFSKCYKISTCNFFSRWCNSSNLSLSWAILTKRHYFPLDFLTLTFTALDKSPKWNNLLEVFPWVFPEWIWPLGILWELPLCSLPSRK
mgnify:CR=1 FL=1